MQIEMFDGRAAKEAGMAQAVTHADTLLPEWSTKAYNLLIRFLSFTPGPFMAEDVRKFAGSVDFPPPPSLRAWGGVIGRAAKEQLIKRVGFGQVKNPKAHMANAAVWQKI